MARSRKAKRLPHTRLAVGEATGHHHSAAGPDVALYETAPDTLYLSAPSGAEVTHPEHRTVTLPPGEYDRLIVREYDHFGGEDPRESDRRESDRRVVD
jgi:hypothetical protein